MKKVCVFITKIIVKIECGNFLMISEFFNIFRHFGLFSIISKAYFRLEIKNCAIGEVL